MDDKEDETEGDIGYHDLVVVIGDDEAEDDENDFHTNGNAQRQQHTPQHPQEQEQQERDTGIPSNETLLSTAFISFTAFMIVQSFVAFIAKSEAMMGDSAAMAVDSMTYAFNLCAERMKNKADQEDANTDYSNHTAEQKSEMIRVQRRERRKMRLHLELVPPLISVSTLIGVTIVVMHDSITTLILDARREEEDQSNPNVEIMFAFSTFNLFLDFFNVFCFAKAKHAMGYNTMDDEGNTTVAGSAERRKEKADEVVKKIREGARRGKKKMGLQLDNSDEEYAKLRRSSCSNDEEDFGDLEMNPTNHLEKNTVSQGLVGADEGSLANSQDRANGQAEVQMQKGGGNRPRVDEDLGAHSNDDAGEYPVIDSDVAENAVEKHERANLNMCSAYTHVFADTCRSIAVVVAACIAELVDGVTAEEADATAAVAVSILILLSLIPLFQGLVQTATELKSIRDEERAEEAPDIALV